MKKLYKFIYDYGRHGMLHGLFIADEESVKQAVGKHVYFGEVLGKHSEVQGDLTERDFLIQSEDQELIQKLLDVFEKPTLCGYNPLHYISGEEE